MEWIADANPVVFEGEAIENGGNGSSKPEGPYETHDNEGLPAETGINGKDAAVQEHDGCLDSSDGQEVKNRARKRDLQVLAMYRIVEVCRRIIRRNGRKMGAVWIDPVA